MLIFVYGTNHDAAWQMAKPMVRRVPQCRDKYSGTDRQLLHRPLPSGVPIQSNFDAAGIRVAEYRFNPGTGFSALLRE